MKKLVLLFALTFSSAAFADNTISDYPTAVAAEMMARQVLQKRLLPNNQLQYDDLKRALEGSGSSKTRNTITGMICDRALGKDLCSIQIVGSIEGDSEGFSFSLDVTIYQGKVISARISDFVG